jgi:hypothetical protein
MEWHPIESAPRDGTVILGYGMIIDSDAAAAPFLCAWHDDTRGPGVSDYVQAPGWEAFAAGRPVENEGWDTGHGFTLAVEPTHWMPLPAPPTPSTAPAEASSESA